MVAHDEDENKKQCGQISSLFNLISFYLICKINCEESVSGTWELIWMDCSANNILWLKCSYVVMDTTWVTQYATIATVYMIWIFFRRNRMILVTMGIKIPFAQKALHSNHLTLSITQETVIWCQWIEDSTKIHSVRWGWMNYNLITKSLPGFKLLQKLVFMLFLLFNLEINILICWIFLSL